MFFLNGCELLLKSMLFSNNPKKMGLSCMFKKNIHIIHYKVKKLAYSHWPLPILPA